MRTQGRRPATLWTPGLQDFDGVRAGKMLTTGRWGGPDSDPSPEPTGCCEGTLWDCSFRPHCQGAPLTPSAHPRPVPGSQRSDFFLKS